MGKIRESGGRIPGRHGASRGGAATASINMDWFPLAAEGISILGSSTIAGLPHPRITTLCALACLMLAGAYRRRLTLSVLDTAPVVVGSSSIGAIVALAGTGPRGLNQVLLVVAAVSSSALFGRCVGYGLERSVRRSGLISRRTAVVGSERIGSVLTERMLTEAECGLLPVVVIDEHASTGSVKGLPLRLMEGGLRSALERDRIDTAIVAFPDLPEEQLVEMIWECERLNCEVFLVPRLWQVSPVRRNMDRIGAIPLCRLDVTPTRRPQWPLKSFAERLLAGTALVLLTPLLIVLAASVYVSDHSEAILFRQRRIGLGGREFELLKFRSMRPANGHEEQTMWSISRDPRLSRLGRILRASSLDELPQLWNVVRGDMALVGPRPERPYFVDKFSNSIPGYAARQRVPAGLTGWSAVNGLRGDTSIEERVRYDNFYIANWNLWLDAKIILRTGWAVVLNFRQDRTTVEPATSDGSLQCPAPSQ